MTYPIPARDPRVHVFSVSSGGLTLAHQTYLSRLDGEGDATPLVEALGAPVDATYAEVFAVDDIKPMSLRDYLTQAHDIPAETLARDAARLDGLQGDVVVLASRAVEGVDALAPRPELTPIGAYAPAEADNTPRELPRAAPQPEAPTPAPEPVLNGGRVRSIWIVVGALIAAAILIWLL